MDYFIILTVSQPDNSCS